MAYEQAQPSAMPAPGVQTLEEPQIGLTGKACSVGGGIVAAVC